MRLGKALTRDELHIEFVIYAIKNKLCIESTRILSFETILIWIKKHPDLFYIDPVKGTVHKILKQELKMSKTAIELEIENLKKKGMINALREHIDYHISCIRNSVFNSYHQKISVEELRKCIKAVKMNLDELEETAKELEKIESKNINSKV